MASNADRENIANSDLGYIPGVTLVTGSDRFGSSAIDQLLGGPTQVLNNLTNQGKGPSALDQIGAQAQARQDGKIADINNDPNLDAITKQELVKYIIGGYDPTKIRERAQKVGTYFQQYVGQSNAGLTGQALITQPSLTASKNGVK